MTIAALPQLKSKARRSPLIWAVAGLLAAGAAGGIYLAISGSEVSSVAIAPTQFYTVAPMDLEVRVTKDGEIHAVENLDITCKVEGSSTITWLVKEGASVKKGDTLLTLDSTDIRQKLEDTDLQVKKAEADVSNSREMLEITRSSNATSEESADVAKTLAELDLKQYEQGIYPQQLMNAKTEVDMAQITVANRLDDFEQTRRLYSKSFVTEADLKKADLDLKSARNALDKAQTALKLLTDYTHEMELTSRNNAVAQAKQRVARTQRENASNLAWRQADLDARAQSLSLLKRRFDRLKEQLSDCTVIAPADGMVIYGSTTDRYSNSSMVQEGAQVRERQLLIRLPDTSAMKAVIRVNEAVVPRLKEGQPAMVKIIGVPEPVGAKLTRIAVVADSSFRFWNPDLREYPVDLYLDKTPRNLKPGISATVEVFVDRLPDVLAVPIDAVYTAGEDRYVFVSKGESVEPRKVKVGMNNDTHVQVVSGLEAGMKVARLQVGQGRELLEKAGIKLDSATSRPSGKGSRRRGPQKS